MNLRPIFFSDNLPVGKGVSEIFWVLLLIVGANLVGYLCLLGFIAIGIEQNAVLEWTWPTVMFWAGILFAVRGFAPAPALLTSLGLALTVRGFWDSTEYIWQAQIIAGVWLALRFFSVGPKD